MRIKFRIGIGMVNAVHDAVSSRAQVRGTLGQPGKEKEELLPAPAHVKRLVSSVAVLKKSLREQRQVPVQYKKEDNKNHDETIELRVNIHLRIFDQLRGKTEEINEAKIRDYAKR